MLSENIPEGKSLVYVISELLAKHNHPAPRNWEAYVHRDAFDSHDRGVQRFLINRYWHQEIGLYDENTIDVRMCLIDQGSIDDWLRLFEQCVIPCVIRNTLPKTTS